ncbi:alkaline phosphatase D family protein [Stutzerimonas azotifigens]|uniref:alkaline phosphatase D family protein n=1 Tax=Stutzerimonas azotifigens TaxID=291995 RepID=UPI0003FA1C9C|nr:alkaline phosphatase D family protein [Stutzerimonas azotifigens]
MPCTQPDIPDALPAVLAGPLLRRVEPGRLVFWLATTGEFELTLRLRSRPDGAVRELPLDGSCRAIALGRHCWLQLVDLRLDEPLPTDRLIEYDLQLGEPGARQGIAAWAPHLLNDDGRLPAFAIRSRLDRVLHGSCRKPHHPTADGLLCVDRLLGELGERVEERPALLLMSGDQVYADDVAGPMLVAIHVLMRRLGLFGECLREALVEDSEALLRHPACYYRREELLPASGTGGLVRERIFGGVEKPVFTTAHGQNHLVTLAEVMAMYLLVWSPTPWALVEMPMPPLEPELEARFARETECLTAFRTGLPRVARALAQMPSLMIFDDHDITDDWNLSARWEQTAYGHPFSRRIIGNALVAYLLCQGWGNEPERFEALLDEVQALTARPDAAGHLDCAAQDVLIDRVLAHDGWGYTLDTQPPLLVLDTRTRRWRSERNLGRPSGLMDWEALSELQQALLDRRAALIVSPAPMFGVKLIEAIQRVFTWAGHPLLVDAENWMAHRGAARVMLNIFRHSRTPGRYVVLSGDVHYSFVYQVSIRGRDGGPQIWQVTSSGVKNEFPQRLLDWLDRLNRWLYAPWSPLNWLTTRRRWEVVPRVPDRRQHGERLWNGAGIGLLELDEEGAPRRIRQLNADGSPATEFLLEDEA